MDREKEEEAIHNLQDEYPPHYFQQQWQNTEKK